MTTPEQVVGQFLVIACTGVPLLLGFVIGWAWRGRWMKYGRLAFFPLFIQKRIERILNDQ